MTVGAARWFLRARPTLPRNYVTTLAASALVIIAYLVSLRIVASRLGLGGFGEYALARRNLQLILPLSTLNADVAIARFVAYRSHETGGKLRSYLSAGLFIIVCEILVLTALLIGLRVQVAILLFGSDRYASLILTIPLLLLGGALYGIIFGYLRGQLRIQRANALTVLILAFCPLAGVFLGGSSVTAMLAITGLGWVMISGVALALLLPLSFIDVRERLAELVKYGVPRVPGDLLQVAMFVIPGILIVHLANIELAGVTAFGVSVLGFFGAGASALGMVLLPVSARLLGRGSTGALRAEVLRVASSVLAATLGLTVFIEVAAHPLATLYLGARFASGAEMLRVIVLAALPWATYVLLRNVIDARHMSAINTRNIGISFAVFLGLASLVTHWSAAPLLVIATLVAALYLLGALTVLEVVKILRSPEGTTGEDYYGPVGKIDPLS
jgi:O-antigen/teichoic acid export membrane protein